MTGLADAGSNPVQDSAVRRLRESEERFRLAFEHAPIAKALISLDGRYELVNPAMCSFTGYSEQQLLNLTVADLTHPADLQADQWAMTNLLRTEKATYTLKKRYLTAGGGIVWGEKSAALLRHEDGSPQYFVSQTQDITARREHDHLLAEERRRLRNAETIGRVGSWELDIQSGALTLSAGLIELWGMDPARFDGDLASATKLIHRDDVAVVEAAIRACANTGEPIHLRYRITRGNDGAQRWIDARGEAFSVSGGAERIGGSVIDVTEQVLADADARSAQSFQQAVFSASPDVISVWDYPSQSILWTNRSIPAILGYSDRDVDEMAGDLKNAVVPEDRPGLDAALAAARDAPGDEVVHVDYRMRRKDGAIRWFSQRTAPLLRDGRGQVTQVVGILRDATEEMAAQDAARDSEALFKQLTDSLDVVLIIRGWDPSEFLYVSPGYQKILGYDPITTKESPEDSLRRIHPADRDRFRQEYWSASAAGGSARIDYRIFRPDGEIRWLRATTMPVAHPPGTRRRSASIVEDITVSRQTEEALNAARDAEKANTAKNEFLSRMSHELRTPLNAVLGFAQLLELDDLGRDQQEAVRQIIRGGTHLMGLIDDVLDISKIEGDRLDMSIEPVSVFELLTETVAMMRIQARAAEVSLLLRPAGDRAQMVLADHRRLRQVVLNLLSNAIKYNHPGGRVEVSCSAAANSMQVITVLDTGRGIREQDLPRLFTPFDRLGAQDTGIEGTGVGLALSHRLMTAMGGTLTATSQAGAGSIFMASIPAAALPSAADRQAADPPPMVAGTGPGPESSPLGTRILLYIEDNSSNVALMKQLIARRPIWKLVVAGTGALGLELAGSSPDLVLLDMHLPDMDGIDILHRLRSDPGTSGLTIVVVSADANPHQIQRLLATGADDYLTKPLNVAELFTLLDSVAARALPHVG